jgi:Ca2+-binding RTX toxin-like protein
MADITGTSGNDPLFGTNGADQMNALDGDDTLEGDQGNDSMSGGPGNDAFIIRPGDGHDRISDFNTRRGDDDTLVFNSFANVHSFGDIQGHMTRDRKSTVIDVSGAEGDPLGSQSVTVRGNVLTPDNVEFDLPTPLPGAFVVEDPPTPLPGAFVVGEEPPSEFTSLRSASSDWMFG